MISDEHDLRFWGCFRGEEDGECGMLKEGIARSRLPSGLNPLWDLILSSKKSFTPISHGETPTNINEYKYSKP
jgi:hypothetical protein